MAQEVRTGTARGISEGLAKTLIEGARDGIKEAAKTTGSAAIEQMQENLFGWGPKDEGNYNAAINAVNDSSTRVKLEEWLSSREEYERNWFRRVISNMVADAVATGKENDLQKAAEHAAATIEDIVENYPEDGKRTEAARMRGLLKPHRMRKALEKLTGSEEDDETKEAREQFELEASKLFDSVNGKLKEWKTKLGKERGQK